jgi:hypothetical protein
MIGQELAHIILQEIDTLLKNGVLPITTDHLKHLSHEGNIVEHLITMKKEGLISGDTITLSAQGTPYRMTNIRLTYAGIRALRQ